MKILIDSRKQMFSKRRKSGKSRTSPETINDVSRLRTKVRNYLQRIQWEKNYLDVYSTEGWNGRSREMIKPKSELNRANEKISELKLSIREVLRRLREASQVGAINPEAFDLDGSLSHELIFCANCKMTDEEKDNDIILCDGECNRGFHQKCLNPPLPTSEIPIGDEGWLCPECDCYLDCIDDINYFLDLNLPMDINWKAVFPEADSLNSIQETEKSETKSTQKTVNYESKSKSNHEMSAANILHLNLPSDESDDEDFDPEKKSNKSQINENQIDRNKENGEYENGKENSGTEFDDEDETEDDDDDDGYGDGNGDDIEQEIVLLTENFVKKSEDASNKMMHDMSYRENKRKRKNDYVAQNHTKVLNSIDRASVNLTNVIGLESESDRKEGERGVHRGEETGEPGEGAGEGAGESRRELEGELGEGEGEIGAEEIIDESVILLGKRNRKSVDYKTLNDEMFGEKISKFDDSLTDEEWSPRKRQIKYSNSNININSTVISNSNLNILPTVAQVQNGNQNQTLKQNENENQTLKQEQNQIPNQMQILNREQNRIPIQEQNQERNRHPSVSQEKSQQLNQNPSESQDRESNQMRNLIPTENQILDLFLIDSHKEIRQQSQNQNRIQSQTSIENQNRNEKDVPKQSQIQIENQSQSQNRNQNFIQNESQNQIPVQNLNHFDYQNSNENQRQNLNWNRNEYENQNQIQNGYQHLNQYSNSNRQIQNLNVVVPNDDFRFGFDNFSRNQMHNLNQEDYFSMPLNNNSPYYRKPIFNESCIDDLEKLYLKNPYSTREEKEIIAHKYRIKLIKIHTWFSNRRRDEKRRQKANKKKKQDLNKNDSSVILKNGMDSSEKTLSDHDVADDMTSMPLVHNSPDSNMHNLDPHKTRGSTPSPFLSGKDYVLKFRRGFYLVTETKPDDEAEFKELDLGLDLDSDLEKKFGLVREKLFDLKHLLDHAA